MYLCHIFHYGTVISLSILTPRKEIVTMRKITITVDSVIQTKEQIDDFARYLLLFIQDEWEILGAKMEISGDGYNMKMDLPEII